MIVQGAIVVTLTSVLASSSASTWASHLKVLRQSMLWARQCQASYPVWGQVLFFFWLDKRNALLAYFLVAAIDLFP